MTPNDGFDTLLTEWLRAEASELEPAGFHAGMTGVVRRTKQRRRWTGPLGIALPRVYPWTGTSAVRTAVVPRSLVWAGLLALLAVALAVAAAALVGARPSPLPRVYDDVFVPAGSLAEARSAHTATLLPDGRVLVVGGDTGGFGSVTSAASAELWDPASGSFGPGGSLVSPQSFHTATLLPNGSVLIVGRGAGTGRSATAELWDPTTATFQLVGSLGASLEPQTATLLPDGRVLILSLAASESGENGTTAEFWDPNTESFTPAMWKVDYRAYYTATLLSDGTVLIVGGDTGALLRGSTEILDPITGNIREAGSLSERREGPTATLMPDGKVLIVGGDDWHAGPSWQARMSAELWDPASQSSSKVGSLTYGGGIDGHTATLLQDGRVLVIGGGHFVNGPQVSGAAAVWDPKTMSFNPATPPLQARAEQTATLLSDGRVLVVGGRGADGSRLATAELYQ